MITIKLPLRTRACVTPQLVSVRVPFSHLWNNVTRHLWGFPICKGVSATQSLCLCSWSIWPTAIISLFFVILSRVSLMATSRLTKGLLVQSNGLNGQQVNKCLVYQPTIGCSKTWFWSFLRKRLRKKILNVKPFKTVMQSELTYISLFLYKTCKETSSVK